MSTTVEFPYTKIKQLGRGRTCEMHLVQDKAGKKYAYKQFDTKLWKPSEQQNEISILRELDHKNIVKMQDVTENGIILELLDGGELFDLIDIPKKPFPVKVARFYFKQLLEGLQYMHKHKIAHRDIKLENILLDKECNLKIADLGFASKYAGEHELLKDSFGTEGYISPEKHKYQPYNPEKSDVFSAGITLFCMLYGFPPIFKRATREDPLYKLFINGQQNQFWAFLSRKTQQKFGSAFENLINNLLEANPEKRLSIEQILSHPWMQEDEIDSQELKEEMIKRFEMIEKSKTSTDQQVTAK